MKRCGIEVVEAHGRDVVTEQRSDAASVLGRSAHRNPLGTQGAHHLLAHVARRPRHQHRHDVVLSPPPQRASAESG